MEGECRDPGSTKVGAARYINVVVVSALGLLNAGFAGSVDRIHVVGQRIGYDRSCRVVESGIRCDAALAHNGISDLLPTVTVVIRALEANQGTVTRVMVGEVDVRGFRRDPGAVGSCSIDYLRRAGAQIETGHIRARDRCHSQGRRYERWVYDED